MAKLRSYGLMLIAIPLTMVAYRWDGEFGVTRLFGGIFAGIGIYVAFVKDIPLHFGSELMGRLSGWSKAWVVVPVVTLGAAMIIWAPEVTCISTKYKHLCA